MSRPEPPSPMPTRLERLAMEIYADDISGEDPADLLRELLRDQIATKLMALVTADAPGSESALTERASTQEDDSAKEARALRSP